VHHVSSARLADERCSATSATRTIPRLCQFQSTRVSEPNPWWSAGLKTRIDSCQQDFELPGGLFDAGVNFLTATWADQIHLPGGGEGAWTRQASPASTRLCATLVGGRLG
jgi:hypothetical protein